MKKMKMYLVFAMLGSMLFMGCNKDDESTAPTTDFDVTTLTDKKYKPGDIIEADMRINPKGKLTESVEVYPDWLDSDNQYIDQLENWETDITPTRETFTFHFEYEIPAEVKSGDKIEFTINTNVPEENIGPIVFEFTIEIE